MERRNGMRRIVWLAILMAFATVAVVLMPDGTRPRVALAQSGGGSIVHSTVADFGAICAAPTNVTVSSANGGELRLSATVEDYFDGTTLDAARWNYGIANPSAGNTNLPVVAGGQVTLDGNYMLSQVGLTAIPRVYEARARLMQTPNTSGRPDLGFYRDAPPLYNPNTETSSIRLFVGGDADANNLIVRGRNTSDPIIDIDIVDPDETQFHNYRVEWESNETRYYIDDVLQAMMPITTTTPNSRVFIYHQDPIAYGATPMNVDWVRAGQYAANGAYVSCVLDGGQSVDWTTLVPTATVPTGTALSFRTRTSNDAVNWSAWSSTLVNNITSPNGRYLQYAIDLSTTNFLRSPQVDQVSVNFAPVNTTPLSVRFYGHGVSDIDRIKIQIDDPANNNPGPAADIGATDFTVEFWMKATVADNLAPAVTCGANNNWILGNVIVDRDRFNQDRNYGISVAGGRIVFGVSGAGTGNLTICSTTNVLDGQWHHIAAQRRLADGWMWLYVDGVLDGQGDGPDGDIAYPDNGVPGNFCGVGGNQPCTNSDPYLVFGAEKHDISASYPSYNGLMDEVRLSTIMRYTVNFVRPSAAFVVDASTAALYHLDEGPIGNCAGAILDAAGASHGLCNFGGTAPSGPVYTTDNPFVSGTPTATPTNTPLISPTPTNTPLATATPTNTPLPPTVTNTPLPATATNTPLPPTATATPTNTPLPGANFALSFDGTNDLVRANQVIGTGPLTIEAWVRPAVSNANAVLIAGGDDNTGWSLELNGGRATFWLATNQGWQAVQHTTALAGGQWYHVAATYSAGSARLFVNGNAGTSASVGILTQGPTMSFGGLAGYPFFNGAMDEVRISNVVRYTATFALPTAPFTPDANTLGLWHFDAGTGQIAVDTSTTGNNATLGATLAVGADDPTWVTGYAFASGTATPVATNTPLPPTATSTRTNTPLPATPTNTPLPPTATRTNTPLPPTATNTPLPATATNTPLPPTATRTNTPLPPTATNTPLPVTATNTPLPATATPTNTPLPPTATPTRTNTPLPPTATATRTNTPLPPTATPTSTPLSSGNSGLQFDGTNDLVSAGQVVGTGPLTIEAWVRPAVNTETGVVIVGADENVGWSLELASGRAIFWMFNGSQWRSLQHNTTLQANQWYHIAATYSAGSVRVFVNGNASTASTLGTLTQGPWLRFGGLTGYPFYNGVIDEVRISNSVRYSANFTPPASLALDANTIGLWRFNEGNGQTTIDASPSGNHAVLGATSGTETSDPVWIGVTR